MKQNRARLQLRQLIREVLTEDKKVKIYVQKGKKPPKGKSLKTGPRGGQYFVGSPDEKQTYEKGGTTTSTSKPASKPKVNIFDKPTTTSTSKPASKPKVNIFDKPTKKKSPTTKLPSSIKQNLMPAGEYMDGIIDVETDNFEDSPEDSMVSDYNNVKNYITKKWPNATMLSSEDEGGEDIGDFMDEVESGEPLSEKKFGENLTITDYGDYAIFLYNDVGGSMTTLIAK